MRVGFEHLGQSVDFVVSITFLRSPVLAILAMGEGFSFLGCLCTHGKGIARGFNGAVLVCLQAEDFARSGHDPLLPV
jgi:hypothetical protein